jgi:hypothetical protein
MSMDATAKAISAFLLENWPNIYCFPCLAVKVQVTEKEAREGAQALILLAEFRMARSRCVNCGRQDDLIQVSTQGWTALTHETPMAR